MSARLGAFIICTLCVTCLIGTRVTNGVARFPLSANAHLLGAPIGADSDVLLVQPRVGLTPADLEQQLAALGYVVLPRSPLLGAARVQVPRGSDAQEWARRIAAAGLDSFIEPDSPVHGTRIATTALWGTEAPYMSVIHAPEAWDQTTGSPQVLIAVVDTGVDVTHPALAGQIWTNPLSGGDQICPGDLHGCSFVSLSTAAPTCNYQTPAPNGLVQDDDGHGTFVAGVAAAAGTTQQTVAGVAWQSQVLPVKVLDCTETGRASEAAAGILYAAQMGARVIIAAFSSTTDSRILSEAVAEATDMYGALVIAPTGNEGTGAIDFPAGDQGSLPVSGTGMVAVDGTVNYGVPAAFSNNSVPSGVSAPAERILGPVPASLCGQRGWNCISGQPYALASGTSFAAAIVGGAAALAVAEHPGSSPRTIAALLVESQTPLATGNGELDIAAALNEPVLTSGAVPKSGFALTVFSGGTDSQLVAASGCPAETAAFWTSDGNGGFVVLVPGSQVAVVNEAWETRFANLIPATTPLIVKCS